LCKKIVEWHGGRIWLDTERTGPGFGTTFAWTLPVAAVGHAIMDPAPPTTEHSSPESEAAENQAVEHVARQDHDAQGQSRSVVLSTEGGQG
jgi:hypothetical protein